MSRPIRSARNLQRAGLVDRAGEDAAARGLLDGHGFAGDAGFVDERMARRARAVDGDAPAGSDKDRIADGKVLGRDGTDGAGAAHSDLARQEFEKIADRLAATTYGHALEHLRDQDEESDDERGEELADRRRRDDGDRHRQLHRHAPLEEVLERLLEDRPAADQQAGDADYADRGNRLPYPEPERPRGKRNEGNPHGFHPSKGMVMVVVFMVMVVLTIIAMIVSILIVMVMAVMDIVRGHGCGFRRYLR